MSEQDERQRLKMACVAVEIPQATFDQAMSVARAWGHEDVSVVIYEAVRILAREEAIRAIANLDTLRRSADTDRVG